MSQECKEPPDIDVDFEHERREEVIQRIYETYGRSRFAREGQYAAGLHTPVRARCQRRGMSVAIRSV